MEQRAIGQWAMGYGFRIPNRIPNTLNKYTHMGQGKWLTRSFTTRSFTTLKTMKGTGYDEGYEEGTNSTQLIPIDEKQPSQDTLPGE